MPDHNRAQGPCRENGLTSGQTSAFAHLRKGLAVSTAQRELEVLVQFVGISLAGPVALAEKAAHVRFEPLRQQRALPAVAVEHLSVAARASGSKRAFSMASANWLALDAALGKSFFPCGIGMGAEARGN